MNQLVTLDRGAPTAKPAGRFGYKLAAIVALTGLMSAPAQAVDGCLVLLCLAAPSWSAIPQCVPPVQQVLRDLALGRPFPTCAMAGAGNQAANHWASAPDYCPPQYTQVTDGEAGQIYNCAFTGAVEVSINGELWARVWWSMGGETVTEYSPTAKATLGTWDTKFDDDYAAWLAQHPPPPPPGDSGS